MALSLVKLLSLLLAVVGPAGDAIMAIAVLKGLGVPDEKIAVK